MFGEGSWRPKKVRIIDTKAGDLACELAIGEADFAILEWSSDDNYIAGLVNRLGDSLEMSVWDATTGQLATTSTMPARMPVGQITDPQFRHIQKDNSFLIQAKVAEALDISLRTCDRLWAFARAWLYRHLQSGQVEN